MLKTHTCTAFHMSRIMRWLVLHSNSHKETLQLDKRALIQVCISNMPYITLLLHALSQL